MITQRHRKETLEPGWKGPYSVILTVPTDVKMDASHLDSPFSHMKPVDSHADSEDCTPEGVNHGLWRVIAHPQGPLKLRVHKVTNPAKWWACPYDFLAHACWGFPVKLGGGALHKPHLPFNLTWKINAGSGKS